jgi:hypothetical protein
VCGNGLYRSVAEPQCDLGAQASAPRTRSPDHGVATQTLVYDARMTTPPPAADSRTSTLPPAADARVATPPPTADAGTQGAVVDVGTSASPRVIDVDPISMVPGGADEDLVRDQAQIAQVPKDPGTSSTQVPDSSSSSLR